MPVNCLKASKLVTLGYLGVSGIKQLSSCSIVKDFLEPKEAAWDEDY